MRTVLMVTYCYPPMGSPGALRSAKFAKYLPSLGWSPLVLTPNAGYSRLSGLEDHVDLPGVQVVRTRDTARVKHALAAASNSTKRSHFPTLAARIGRAVLIPDRDVTWYPFAMRAARELVESRSVNAVYSTSPSITNHLVARGVAQTYGLPWVADFRDAWTISAIYSQPRWRRTIERAIEAKILREASRVTLVSEEDRHLYASWYVDQADKLRVIRNGFDDSDFGHLQRKAMGGRFVLAHVGSFYGGARNPTALFNAIAVLKRDGVVTPENFQLELVGVPEPAIRELAGRAGISDVVSEVGPLPYRDAIVHMRNASALLLITHSELNAISAKFYDYLGARRPVLALTSPASELARLVCQEGIGDVIRLDDAASITEWLSSRIATVQRDGDLPDVDSTVTSRFTRHHAAQSLARLLDEITIEQGTTAR